MPKPMMICPILPESLDFMPITMIIPMISARGARVEGFKNCRNAAPDVFKSRSRMICPVTVVPTLAPMMMPRDCRREMIPAPTSPEVITIVAVEDWTTAVVTIPRRNALSGVPVTLSIAFFSVPEELAFSPSPIMRIPYRNIARPPKSVIALKIFMSIHL